MPVDTIKVGSPGWWLVRLIARLQGERPHIDYLDKYYSGSHELPPGVDGFAKAYQSFQLVSRSNFLSLVVEAPLERMRVVGFRTGQESENEEDDEKTAALWQQSHMDADQLQVHRTALSLGRAYVIVGPHPRKTGEVLITPEHPTQVYCEMWPDDKRQVRAAIKLWQDDYEGNFKAVVFLPGKEYHYVSGPLREVQPFMTGSVVSVETTVAQNWELVRTATSVTGDEIPVVPFYNRPNVLGLSRSEFEDVIPIQDRCNVTLLHRLVSEKFAAFRQKVILNLEFEQNDDGTFVPPDLPSDPSVAWLLQGEGLNFHEFSQTDTANILAAIESDVTHIASITKTPPHYLLGAIVNASGDALKSAEAGLVNKVRERMTQFGESWEMVMHLAHKVNGDSAADVVDMETRWADPEAKTLGELADATLKKRDIGVPWRQCMVDLGYSPAEIRRMESERMADAEMQGKLAEAGMAETEKKAALKPLAQNKPSAASGAPSKSGSKK